MELSGQEYWSGLPLPPPGDFPNPEIKPGPPALQADFFTIWATREALCSSTILKNKTWKDQIIFAKKFVWIFPSDIMEI